MRFDHELESSDLTAKHVTVGLLVLYAAWSAVRIALTSCVDAPIIFGDEWGYFELARSIAERHAPTWAGVPVRLPCLLYPLLISPFLFLPNALTAVKLIQAFNVILSGTTIFLTYGFAREFAGRSQSLIAAALAGLLPGFCYSATIMAENAFLPAFSLGLWFAFRAIDRPTIMNRIIAGLSFALAFHVKPHGLYLPIIFAVSLFCAESINLIASGWNREAPRKLFFALLGQWLTAVAYVIGLIPRFIVASFVEHQPNLFNAHGILGDYYNIVVGQNAFSLGNCALALLASLIIWILAGGLLPAAAWFRESVEGLSRAADPRRRLLAILILISTGLILAVVSRHTVLSDNHWRIHERYFMVGLPGVIVLYATGSRNFNPARKNKNVVVFFQIFSLLTVAVLFYTVGSLFRWAAPTDSPTLSSDIPFIYFELVPKVAIVTYALVIASALVLFIAAHWRPGWELPAVAGILISCNAGWYLAHQFVTKSVNLEDRKIARKTREKMAPGDRLLVLADGLDLRTASQAGFLNPGMQVYKSPPSPTWYHRPLQLGADGLVISPYPPEQSWLLATSGLRFNRQPDKGLGPAQLFKIGGDPPLRLLDIPNEKPAKSASPEIVPSDLEIKIGFLSKLFAPQMVTGRTYSVQVTIRNQGANSFPGGETKPGIGYRWRNSELAGDSKPTALDNSHYALLPEGLAPGEIFAAKLEIAAPDAPGDRWELKLCPMVIRGENRLWLSDGDCSSEQIRVIAP